MSEAIDILNYQLADFGLDPRDWELRLIQRKGEVTKFEVVSDDCVLEGCAESADWLWLRVIDREKVD